MNDTPNGETCRAFAAGLPRSRARPLAAAAGVFRATRGDAVADVGDRHPTPVGIDPDVARPAEPDAPALGRDVGQLRQDHRGRRGGRSGRAGSLGRGDDDGGNEDGSRRGGQFQKSDHCFLPRGLGGDRQWVAERTIL